MKEIEKILSDQIKKNKTPGLRYVFFDREKHIYSYQSGFSDIKNQKKIEVSTTFNAYSATKTFTALAILQLAEKGKLNINDSAKLHLEEFHYPTSISISDLLNHSSGIPNPNPLPWIHLAEEHSDFDSDDYFKQVFKKNIKTKYKPKERFAYSNLGYVLLGKIISRVSGQTYEDYIRTNILESLEIPANQLSFSISDKNSHAKGYQKKISLINLILGFFIDKAKFFNKPEGKWVPFKNMYVNGASYGGLIGTPDAFVVYLQDLMKSKSKLVSSEYKKLLFSENTTSTNKKTGMCLSWFKGTLHDKVYYCHAGGGGGYYIEIRIYPELNVGSVIMFNRTGMTDERFLDSIDAYFISK